MGLILLVSKLLGKSIRVPSGLCSLSIFFLLFYSTSSAYPRCQEASSHDWTWADAPGAIAQGFRRSWLHGFQSKVGPKLISESSSLRIPNGKECPFGLHVRSSLCSQYYDGCRRKTHRCLKRLFRTAMGFFRLPPSVGEANPTDVDRWELLSW